LIFRCGGGGALFAGAVCATDAVAPADAVDVAVAVDVVDAFDVVDVVWTRCRGLDAGFGVFVWVAAAGEASGEAAGEAAGVAAEASFVSVDAEAGGVAEFVAAPAGGDDCASAAPDCGAAIDWVEVVTNATRKTPATLSQLRFMDIARRC